jgi:membrane protein
MSDREAELTAATADREEALSGESNSAAAESDKRQSGSKSVAIWRTGWEVVKETFEGVDQLEIPLRAAAVAYYGLLAIFPLLLFFISLGSVLLSRSEVREALNEFLNRAIPAPSALAFVQQTISDTLARRGAIGVFSLLVLLWSASSLFANLEVSLNRIWEVPRRMVWHRRLLGILAVMILAGLFLVVIFLSTLEALPLLNGLSLFDSFDLWFTFLAATLFFWLIYRWLPNAKVPAVPSLAGGALWAFVTGTILYVGAVFSAVLQRHFWE